MDERYTIPLFADLPAAELQWFQDNSREVHLDKGDYLLRENGPAELFYVVLAGELQITRTINGTEQVAGTTPAGVIGGEIALLKNTPSHMSANAIVPSDLLVLDAANFHQMFAFAPTLAARVLEIAVQRMQGVVTSLVQQEKMAALGRLTAGLAHELKNPAASTNRASNTLREALTALQTQAVKLNGLGLSDDQIERLVAFQQRTIARSDDATTLSPVEQSDREDDMGDWLDDQGIDNGWEMASCFVGSALAKDDLTSLTTDLPADSLPDVLAWLHQTLETSSLLNDIEHGTQRIFDLVMAIKSYTYKDQDQTKAQEVDIHKGLDSTLAVLGYKLKKGNIQVLREYDPELPHIQGRGGELNQVWTNLIDNAIDVLDSTGAIRLITRCENDFAMVEVADNGPGIPDDVKPHLFEPFFTTKAAGSGTGLGLDISYRIIQQHNGSIEVQSQPGNTRFIVRLPVKVKG